MRTKLILAAGAAIATLALAGSAAAANLIVNGSFELGNVGFSSDYIFTSTDLGPADRYAIQDSPRNLHGSFSDYGDHTTGDGLMMVLNGSPTVGDRVWYENGIVVAPNTDYFFSTWISSAFPTSPAVLNFSINGGMIGSTFTASTTTGLWQQFFATWNSGSNTTASIALVNANTASSGNDFALDDIQLDTVLRPLPVNGVPEPATWAMMIMGFGGIGALVRRRARAAVA
jgi:hypothetical protein